MINEDRTFKEFGYYSTDLTHGSNKFVYRICLVCKVERAITYYDYNHTCGLCKKCAKTGENNSFYGKHHTEESKYKMSISTSGKNHPMYGKHHSEETKRKMSKATFGENNPMYMKHLSEETCKKLSIANSGKNHPMYGKHHTEETKQKMSATKRGIDIDDWEEYASDNLYDIKFNVKLKAQVRALTNDCDFLTGEHKDICNDGKNLDIHHIDYNKQNSNIINLIPLSKSNHSKTNTNRAFWTKLFTNMQHTKYLLEGVNIDENN